VAYILDRALENLLVSHEEMVNAITVSKLAQLLPKEKLGAIIEASLKTHDKFTEEDLLGAVPPSTLVEHVPLDYLWERVVQKLIAEAHDYATKPVSLIGSSATSSVKPSDDGDWDKGTTSEKRDSSVSDEEIVSEDEILDSELNDDDLGTPTGAKKG
jgi:hypothetical protein